MAVAAAKFSDVAADRRRESPTATATAVANFYFGAFGNNYVDDGPIKRYRDYYSLPGFGINEISAQNYVSEMVEWNLPPFVFESAGTPALYLTWLRPSVFAAGLWTDAAKVIDTARSTKTPAGR